MNAILKVNNDYTYLITSDAVFRNKLWEKMRFRQRNYFHTRAYQNGIWDGYINFLDKKTGRFLTGLLPEVELALNNYFKIPYEIKDERNQLEFVYDSIDKDFLKQWTPKGSEPLELYDYQVDLVNQAIKHKRGIVKAPTACHAKGQLILMFDGHLKAVEDIAKNDILMGMNSEPKIVVETHRGADLMYEIQPHKGKSFVVNQEHILTLISTTSHHNRYPGEIGGKIVDVKVKDWLNWSKWQKHIYKLFRVGVDFQNNNKLPLDPYFLGLLLGDGSIISVPNITTIDNEIVEETKNQAKKFNLKLRVGRYKNKTPVYYFSGIKKHINPISEILKNLKIWGKKCSNKFIPDIYKVASKSDRLLMLAGLLDTDGHLSRGSHYDFISKSSRLSEDVAFIARSLGLHASVNECEKSSQNGTKGTYYRVYISGNIHIIPCKVSHKIAKFHKTKNCVNRTGFSVNPIGIGDFYGFSLLNDPHYLMDDFTVTHNSGKTAIMISILKALPPNTPTLFLVNRKLLVSQNYKEMIKWGLENVGRFNSDHHEPNVITCANVQSLHYLDRLLPKFKVLVTDEVHMMSNNTGIRAFKKLTGTSIRIAVSATPFKFGEKDHVQKYTVKGYFGPLFDVESGVDGKLNTALLQNRGMLSDSICRFYPIDEPQIPYDIWMDAVTNGIANNFHFHKIVTRLAGKLNGRTLILVDRIAHGDALSNLIPDSLWVRGEDNEKTREYVIERLQNEKDKVVAIATRQIFDTGINFFVHNIINATDASSEHGVIQLTGRGLRKADDKSILNYYDFLFRINPYLEDHSNDRIKILKKEKHEVVVMDAIDF